MLQCSSPSEPVMLATEMTREIPTDAETGIAWNIEWARTNSQPSGLTSNSARKMKSNLPLWGAARKSPCEGSFYWPWNSWCAEPSRKPAGRWYWEMVLGDVLVSTQLPVVAERNYLTWLASIWTSSWFCRNITNIYSWWKRSHDEYPDCRIGSNAANLPCYIRRVNGAGST